VFAGLDDFASVRESIRQRGGYLGIAEHGAPFAEGQARDKAQILASTDS
jgi:hypothetical protein